VTQNRTGSEAQQLAFRSGEAVPLSGVWRAEHQACENIAEFWIRKDDLFPLCQQCGLETGFTLLEEVQHISEDSDFR
jgi:hypothetical protein